MYDKFKNSKEFRAKAKDSGLRCNKCGDIILEIERKQVSDRVTELFGYFCNTCDRPFFGVLEWAIKMQ